MPYIDFEEQKYRNLLPQKHGSTDGILPLAKKEWSANFADLRISFLHILRAK
jgi:hypothetical protein